MSRLKVHYITGLKNFHGDDTFACGKSQQMFPLEATIRLDLVTCRMCLKALAKPHVDVPRNLAT